ncbi:MAG: tRNA (adenosine(37)-N6)-threonylcarbamoyltransferase complex ATPase subunit type 1 TsaE [Thermodesulfobacteriaceae bacterium]|nr:tRNA (adenosine(37)-N6)-threonylcarbamoyltransferase complex ATPase subunit type 1 TsaE [Thermodesulfobacteriaceae bacterium]MCX8042080.1 tRNA (adenosine(37)-N6)-threonylcarbamoyltransferase complex ATPase subunit type 1 TsaE [Thermodesulfobacteriaceae bacterium]MDW8136726.1 tRNA (adenosine(37)-N6)-threonylcarbamoyltransferase complex ATPase subunit type 1 TsaE [Thermodesulfobacterium sp.]
MEFNLITNKEEETIALGKKLGKLLNPGDLVLLKGDLGSGKTTLVKGIAEGLEVNPEIYITSPTFSLINIYEGRHTLYHVDLYRLEIEDIEELGIWEYLGSGVVVIEWAEKLPQIPKKDFIEIILEFIDYTRRKIIISGYGEWKELLKALERDGL